MDDTFGRILRRMRKSAGLSQMKLAEKIDVSYHQVQKYEYGTTNLSLSRLEQLSDALGFSVSDFLEQVDETTDGGTNADFLKLQEEEKTLFEYFNRLDEPQRENALRILKTLSQMD